jgi:hypothetical protein
VRDGVRLDVVSGGGGSEPSGSGRALRSLETEHVIAATGFRATGERLRLLSDELRGSLATVADGAPQVGRDFESSCPGLFLAGLVTASGFGPAMRFVHGATFTASTLVGGVRRHLRTGTPGGTIPAPSSRGQRGVAPVVRP